MEKKELTIEGIPCAPYGPASERICLPGYGGPLRFRPAVKEDAELLVELYNNAFRKDFHRYGVCPGYGRTREQMEQSIARYPKQVILLDGAPVGVVSALEGEGGIVDLGCLCVAEEHQGKGIGTAAMEMLLSLYPNWKRIELVTPADKEENIRFYTQRCGCRIAGEELDGTVRVVKLVKEKSWEENNQ